MDNKTYIGIDPGKSGAIVVINPDKSIQTFAFPLIGGEYDIPAMNDLFKLCSEVSVHVVIEDVKALQRPLDSGNWSLSRCKAILETLMHVHKIPFTLIHSKTWQKEMWQGVPIQTKKEKATRTIKGKKEEYVKDKTLTKETSLLACQRLFPDVDLRDPDRKTDRGTKAHDGVVDALLMAEYCVRKF